MPSDAALYDERVDRALEALAKPCAVFRSAAAEAADQVQAILAARGERAADGAERAAGELGAFAAGRIDLERFAALFEREADLDPVAALALERAAGVLTEIAGLGAAAHRAAVAPGGDLRGATISALARLGRGFGAARVADLARAGRYRASRHEVWLTAFKPARWNKVERRLAPPLVVEVEGADLRAGGLAELLDGGQKIVLVARGPAPPAPLVRLVTPGVFVLQTPDPGDLARMAGAEGPAVAALLPETAARFVHDPAAGATLAERLTVISLPAEEPRAPLGSYSSAQQAEELRQLASAGAVARSAATLAAGPAASPTDPSAGLPPADPADRLAAWLIARADLSGIGGNGGGR